MPASKVERTTQRDTELGTTAMAFTIRTPVSLAQLDEEIRAACGWHYRPGFTADGDPLLASVETPVTLWLLRDDANQNKVMRAILVHDPDPMFGVIVDPKVIADLREKVKGGKKLTAAEVQTALAHYLLSTGPL